MKATKQVLDRIQTSGVDRWWKPSDLVDLDANPLTVDAIMARLAAAGELQRIRRGLYWRGAQSRFGMTPPSEDDIALEVAGVPGVGPSGLSAANDLGLTTQVPSQVIVAVPRRPPRAQPGIRFVSRAGRIGRMLHELSWMEVAMLEVLTDWAQVIEVDDVTATRRMVALIDDGHVRVDKLVAAAADEPAGCRSRLRSLLHAAGKDREAESVPRPRVMSIQRETVRA